MKHVIVTVPKDRREPGTLLVTDEAGGVLHRCQCLAKSDSQYALQHGNPSRDPTKAGGDTPTGLWQLTTIDERSEGEGLNMGRWVIWLGLPLGGIAVNGDARIAEANGRRELAIHAGRGNDRLVPTHGCIRILDHDAEALHQAIGTDDVQVQVQEAA